MRTRYSECRSSKDTACPLTFKANTACKPSRGAAIIVRDRIEELCKEDADITPKRILIKIIKERKATNCFHKNLIPTLKQVSQLTN